MKIEVLFPEFANLFGDCWNWKYLSRCMPEAELIETGYNDEPRFASEKVDMIIMGAMTEHGQELAIKKLMPHRDRLRELIDCGVVFLMTANAGEVFCEYIENEDGSRVAGLGLVPLHAKRDMMHRFNSTQLCTFEDMDIVGFKAEFSQLYGDNSDFYFAEEIEARLVDKMMVTAEKYIPGLSEHIIIKEVLFNSDIMTASGKGGAGIGIGQVAGQTGAYRPKIKLPVEGAYVVGAAAGGAGVGTELAVNSAIEFFDNYCK